MAIVATRFPTALDEAYRFNPRIDLDIEGVGPVVLDAGDDGQITLGNGIDLWNSAHTVLTELHATGLGISNEADPDDPSFFSLLANRLRFQRQGRTLDLSSNALAFEGDGGFDTTAGDYTGGLGKEVGAGGGGGSGGPVIVEESAAPVALSDVDGTLSYDVILINFTAPGPTAAKMTFYVPAGTPSAMLAAAMGQDPSAIAFCSGEAEFTASPGPVLVSQGVGSSYAYDDAPLLGSAVGTIEVVHTAQQPPQLFWTGSGYAVSYSPFVLNGVDYDTAASEAGITSNAFLFLGVSGGGESVADYDFGYYIRRGEVADRGHADYGFIGLGMDLDASAAVGVVRAPRVILGDEGTVDPRFPSIQLFRAGDYDTDHNDLLVRLGAGGDVDGSTVLRPAYRFAVASDTNDPEDNSGQIFYAERPVAGQPPSFAPPYGDVNDDVEVWSLGWESREAPKVLVLGDMNHFRSGSDGDDRPFGGILMTRDAFSNGLIADPLKAVGETVHIWSPGLYNSSDAPGAISPFTMIMGDPIGSQPGFVLTNSCGGEGAGAGSHDDPWLGFSKRGRRIQAYLASGLDLTDTLFPPPGPSEVRLAALLVSASETEFYGDTTYASGVSTIREIGATPPSGHYDPHPSRTADNPDLRPNINAAYEVEIGAAQYYFQLSDGVSPQPGARNRLALRRQLDYPFAFDPDFGGGSAGPRMPYFLLESLNGTPYYVWVTNAGQLRVSAAEPDDDADAFTTTTA